ncbi:MAG: AfsR/SARP family transcriptional regulator, partial [Nocardioidaceae bacterium]
MDVEIRMLGEFSVTVERVPIPASAWTRRGPSSLVMLLALADGRTMHREQVIDALWPTIPIDAALPRLHKAAHYARRALGGSVVLRNDQVLLLPEADVHVDAVEFRRRAEQALTSRSVEEAEAALTLYGGSLLPEYRYEEWTAEWRNVLTVAYHDLLRLAERWPDLVREVPTDETAHLAVAREHARRGDVRAAQRQLERMEQALRRELGTRPSAEARRLKAELAAESQSSAYPTSTASTSEGTRLVGRRSAGDTVRRQLDQAAAGHGCTLLLTGPAGVGK